MQKRSRKNDLIALIVGLLAANVALAREGVQLRKFSERIDGQPVEVFVVERGKNTERLEWQALPVPEGYPAAGRSLPELSSHWDASSATNANFYREDKPDYQEPIGLLISQGRFLSFPKKYFPSIGVLRGKLQWDNVTAKAWAELDVPGKRKRMPICRFNAQATKNCASLWINKIPADLRRALYLKADGAGPALGRSTYQVVKRGASTWALQWPREPARVARVFLEVSLRGKRFGAKWEKVREAVSGSHALTAKSVYPSVRRSWSQARQPRTLVGASSDGREWIAVFDGRREGSRGVSIPSAFRFLRNRIDATWAVNLDGGGSSTLLHEKRLANKPSDGYPRAVAVGWGLCDQSENKSLR